MALRTPSGQGFSDNHSAICGSSGNPFQQDPATDKVATTKVERGDGDIVISDHDLVNDGDFVIPDDVDSISNPPFIGGGTQSVLGVESDQSNQFSVKFEYGDLDDDGNFTTRFTYDSNDDSKLDSDSSYVILVNVIMDRVKVTLSDSSNAASNDISGGFNSH